MSKFSQILLAIILLLGGIVFFQYKHSARLSEDRIKNRGALVLLEEPYLGEHLWFIPENSIRHE